MQPKDLAVRRRLRYAPHTDPVPGLAKPRRRSPTMSCNKWRPAVAVIVPGALVRRYRRPRVRRGPYPYSPGTRCPAGAVRIDVPAGSVQQPSC